MYIYIQMRVLLTAIIKLTLKKMAKSQSLYPAIVSRYTVVDWTSGVDWWTGPVDWTGGLTFNVLKTTFVLSNETPLSCRFSDDAF